MSVQRVASRYAKSLIDLAQERKSLETIKEDMDSFRQATKNRDFYLLLKSPIVNPTKKASIFKALFEGKYNELTMAFLNIILNKGREEYLPEIAGAFMDQYKKIKHISTIKLTTAVPLSKDALAKIRQKIQEDLPQGTSLEIQTQIQPDLIGGFMLEFDNKQYDASIANKLDQLGKEFKDNLYLSKVFA